MSESPEFSASFGTNLEKKEQGAKKVMGARSQFLLPPLINSHDQTPTPTNMGYTALEREIQELSNKPIYVQFAPRGEKLRRFVCRPLTNLWIFFRSHFFEVIDFDGLYLRYMLKDWAEIWHVFINWTKLNATKVSGESKIWRPISYGHAHIYIYKTTKMTLSLCNS